MKLIVPTNWDIQLLDKLTGYPIHSFYGSLHESIVGSGRISFILPKVNKERVKEYVEEVHARGIKFNYLLNAPCLGNIEYSKKGYQKILEYIEWINNINVDSITITIPYLIEIVKKQFPSLKINVSTIACVNSVQRAKFFEELGVDGITLEYSINRDFYLLKEIRKAISCELILILNNPCLFWCPFQQYHYNVVGHASQLTNRFYLHYCTVRCYLTRLLRPEEILKARWIRPEDVKEYEKIGFNFFKISGRERTTEWITNVVHAYYSRKYEGNLLDIINCVESKSESRANLALLTQRVLKIKSILNYIPNWAFKGAFSIFSKLPVKSKMIYEMLAKMPKDVYKEFIDMFVSSASLSHSLYIDNNKLNGFINFFKRNRCVSCDSCNYCKIWAKKVIHIDQKVLNECISKLSTLLDKLKRSEFI